tara:strand:+ start:1016 stop:1345 length:330 start_codon:yes stop_codon:yes gene_type:complete
METATAAVEAATIAAQSAVTIAKDCTNHSENSDGRFAVIDINSRKNPHVRGYYSTEKDAMAHSKGYLKGYFVSSAVCVLQDGKVDRMIYNNDPEKLTRNVCNGVLQSDK